MEKLKEHQQKCKTSFTLKDENDKDIIIDNYNYNLDELMPFIMNTLQELQDKFNELEKKYNELQKTMKSIPAYNGIREETHDETNSRIKKPIKMNF